MRLLKTGLTESWLGEQDELDLLPHRYGKNIPPYAILSHTWLSDAEDEVLFADVENGTYRDKAGYVKVVEACRQASQDGYEYIWIDTCCVDKTSSAELSEAINSMYVYYQEAAICYAHLVDVTAVDVAKLFPYSRWFDRGWTLQELLAPPNLFFFSTTWERLGSKQDFSRLISEKTGITEDFINGILPVQQASIAQRMSWAADRETTREEDIAYCLMGLFSVNMPMLYGEGKYRAFIRLQEEIMRNSDDQTLFAWVSAPPPAGDSAPQYHGLLADSPADFRHSGAAQQYADIGNRRPYIMTNRGLNIWLPMVIKADGTRVATLQCPDFTRGTVDWLAIYLRRLGEGSSQYARINCHLFASMPEPGQPEQVYVPQTFSVAANSQFVYPLHLFHVRHVRVVAEEDELERYEFSDALRLKLSERERQRVPLVVGDFGVKMQPMFKIAKQAGTLAGVILVTRLADGETFVLKIGSISDITVGFDVCEGSTIKDFDLMQSTFAPRPPGSMWRLKYHDVQITVSESVRDDQKIFSFDTYITAKAREKDLAEAVHDLADALVPGSSSPRMNLFKKKTWSNLAQSRPK